MRRVRDLGDFGNAGLRMKQVWLREPDGAGTAEVFGSLMAL